MTHDTNTNNSGKSTKTFIFFCDLSLLTLIYCAIFAFSFFLGGGGFVEWVSRVGWCQDCGAQRKLGKDRVVEIQNLVFLLMLYYLYLYLEEIL